jgi:hypothetical protein
MSIRLNELLTKPAIDWAHYETQAAEMTDEELIAARVVAFETSRDPMVTGTDLEGCWRDAGSVFAGETRFREAKAATIAKTAASLRLDSKDLADRIHEAAAADPSSIWAGIADLLDTVEATS